MKTPSTICFFNSCKTWGGGEKWHYDMAIRLKNREWRVIAVARSDGPLFRQLQAANLSTYGIRLSNLGFLNPLKVLRIYRILRKEKITAIILNLPADMKAAGLAARLAGVKQIIYRRGSAIPIKNSFLNRFYFSHVLTGVIANSRMTRDTIGKHLVNAPDPQSIAVMYNGIDLAQYDQQLGNLLYRRHGQEIVLGNSGRLVAQKGQRHLIEIAALLKSRGIPFTLLIAGSGPLQGELRALAAARGVTAHIQWLGFVDSTASFMASIDLFLLTSEWEGFGYVLIEAMAAGKPVIAFNASSNPEIVVHERTGYLIDAFDLHGFAAAIERLYHDAALREQLGRAGRERVESNFRIERTLDALESLLRM